MDRELTPEEITELLPAYALDALDDDERAIVEAYLASDAGARDEVDELRVAASMLAHAGGPPPEGVWERLESAITENARTQPTPAPPDVLGARREAASPRRDRRWQWLAAAAAVVALAFGGLWIAERSDSGTATADTAALARQAAETPGARHAALTDASGNTLATAVVTRDGTGYLTSKLPPVAYVFRALAR